MPTKLPRVNVTVTEEQHRLLLELSHCTDLTAAGFLRMMLDAATPLLRRGVLSLGAMAGEDEEDREIRHYLFAELLEEWRQTGVFDQYDLPLDQPDRPTRGAQRSERSERGRTGRRAA
jgi:hypothetical protein